MNIEKLYPAYKDYIWGGNKLKEKYGKNTDTDPLAEAWELSFHKDGLCRLADGRALKDAVSEDELGNALKGFSEFPMLLKFIDAKSDLSVQVHPSDEYARIHESSLGKTEAWYIVSADDGAGIYLGFKRDVTKEEFKEAINNGTLCSLLNFIKVKAGECYFIPAGTIHAIGAGCLICEIQQNSNVTYRVFDYKRKDKNGRERELHIDKAIAVTKTDKLIPKSSAAPTLAECEYFKLEKITLSDTYIGKTTGKSFHSVTCVLGDATIDAQKISQGDTFFVPANHGEYTLCGNGEFLVCSI